MMTAQPLEQWPKWRDELVAPLRWKGVRGDRISDILLETDTHLRETGESPNEAVGDAKAYANDRVDLIPKENHDDDSSLLLIAILSFVGSGLYASGAWAIGAGTNAIFDINAWIVFILGAAIVYIGVWRLPFDLIRHPATNVPLFGGSGRVRALFIGALIIVGVTLYALGRLLA